MSDEFAAALQDPTVRAYAEGVIEGTRMTLNQLDGQGAARPDGVYQGPMPPELRNWIEGARGRLDGAFP